MGIQQFSQFPASQVMPLIREIFFLSADPKNVSEEPLKNEAFFDKWTSYYFRNCPEWISLAWEDKKLLGYLMCEPNSSQALAYYHSRNPSYGLFADQFAEYPAHLHMNAHPDSRGKGVGTALVADLVRRLAAIQIPGVHIITSPGQRNADFYRRNDFIHEVRRDWRGYPLLFMGRKI